MRSLALVGQVTTLRVMSGEPNEWNNGVSGGVARGSGFIAILKVVVLFVSSNIELLLSWDEGVSLPLPEDIPWEGLHFLLFASDLAAVPLVMG